MFTSFFLEIAKRHSGKHYYNLYLNSKKFTEVALIYSDIE